MKKKIVVSVSRRTDIPAYFSDWFRKRLEIGDTFYPNPFNPKAIVHQDLRPEAVKAFVFWTRNPKPLFTHLDYIDRLYNKKHYMHFTINGLPEILELRNPRLQYCFDSVKYLADRYEKDNYVQWRFDPIVLSDKSNAEYHLEKFEFIASNLKGIVRRCYFSFVDLYAKTQRNFKKVESETAINFIKPTLEEQIELTKKLKDIADKYGITLFACAEDTIYSKVPGIEKAHCVDGDIINEICKDEPKDNFDVSPSRTGCGCIESRDIGYYDSCPHGCIYCYANMNPQTALNNARNYQKKEFPMDSFQQGEETINNEPGLFD